METATVWLCPMVRDRQQLIVSYSDDYCKIQLNNLAFRIIFLKFCLRNSIFIGLLRGQLRLWNDHCSSFIREWSVCLGEQHHGPVWARPHFDTDNQTQESAWSRGGVDPANHCWHFSQPGLDGSSNRQVSISFFYESNTIFLNTYLSVCCNISVFSIVLYR